jgi:DNA end-binding protein Ku
MEPKKRVTQEDIARTCKIDQGSVSRILNEDTRDSFAEETVQKVFKVARELGYLHPSLITSNRRESSRRKAEVTGRVQVMIGTNTVYDEGEIDMLYFDKPYFLTPEEGDETGAEAYVVLHDALKETGKVGLGQLVIRGKSNIVAVKPYGKGLSIETLRFADEVQKPDAFFTNVPEIKPDRELVGLAEELIKRKISKFDPKAFKDTYEVALRELIDAKIEDRAPEAIEEPQLGAKVIDLMEALKRSVGSRGSAAKPAKGEAGEAAQPTKIAAAKAAQPKKSSAAGKAKAAKSAKGGTKRSRAA